MPSDRHLPAGCATRPVIRVERGQTSEDDDRLAEEVPVAMHFNGEPFAVMMCTPDHLDDFARGFALTEGQITTLDDITHIEIAEVLEGITLNLTTTSAVGARPARDILSRCTHETGSLLPASHQTARLTPSHWPAAPRNGSRRASLPIR